MIPHAVAVHALVNTMRQGPRVHRALSEFTIKAAAALKAVPAADWDACANPAAGLPAVGGPEAPDPFNPFVSHAFLSALEESGCVGRGTGWSPAHVLVEDTEGQLVGA